MTATCFPAFRVGNDTAPLKPNLHTRAAVHREHIPCRQRHGPIEACSASRWLRSGCTPFRVGNDTAPLKSSMSRSSVAEVQFIPCRQRHGPIEARLWILDESDVATFRVGNDTAPLKLLPVRASTRPRTIPCR